MTASTEPPAPPADASVLAGMAAPGATVACGTLDTAMTVPLAMHGGTGRPMPTDDAVVLPTEPLELDGLTRCADVDRPGPQ